MAQQLTEIAYACSGVLRVMQLDEDEFHVEGLKLNLTWGRLARTVGYKARELAIQVLEQHEQEFQDRLDAERAARSPQH